MAVMRTFTEKDKALLTKVLGTVLAIDDVTLHDGEDDGESLEVWSRGVQWLTFTIEEGERHSVTGAVLAPFYAAYVDEETPGATYMDPPEYDVRRVAYAPTFTACVADCCADWVKTQVHDIARSMAEDSMEWEGALE